MNNNFTQQINTNVANVNKVEIKIDKYNEKDKFNESISSSSRKLSKFEKDKKENNLDIKFCEYCRKIECECCKNSNNNKSLLSVEEKILIPSVRRRSCNRLNSKRSKNSISKSKSYDDSFVFLIIEDNVNISSIQKNLLKITLDKMKKTQKLEFDYTIIVGEDGIDALKFVIDPLLSSRIKGIFTDENMEFMNGSESIKIIRNLQKLNKISYFNICTVTAFEDKATANVIKFMGVDEILKKPLSKSQLEEYFVKYPFIKK